MLVLWARIVREKGPARLAPWYNAAMKNDGSNLPVISCEGCGVCCFHMGYPAFVLPREPMTDAEINSDPELAKLPEGSRKRADLLAGHPGESWWHALPKDLKDELTEHMSRYQTPAYDGTLESFDGPCIWLDTESRLCRHHLHRPNVCRDFETGCGECLRWRKVYEDKIQNI